MYILYSLAYMTIREKYLHLIAIYFFLPQHNIDPVQSSLVIKLTKKIAKQLDIIGFE